MGYRLSRADTFARFDRLTEQLGRATDLVVWPEAATPFVFEREPVYQLQLIALANRAQAPILFGSPALRFYPDRRPYLLNSAYLLSPTANCWDVTTNIIWSPSVNTFRSNLRFCLSSTNWWKGSAISKLELVRRS